MQLSIAAMISIISAVAAVGATAVAVQAHLHSRRTAIKEATESVFNEWWSDELREIRGYFYLEFLPLHRPLLNGKRLKEIEQVIPADKGRAAKLCYYFDKVGWLAATGLIDADYILGPIQHTLRRTWIAMEPLIRKERTQGFTAGASDPVYEMGFEWLYRRTARLRNHQAHLVARRLSHPRIISRRETRALRREIDHDEIEFRSYLRGLGIEFGRENAANGSLIPRT